MNDILYHLCSHSVNIMDGWLPYPSTALSKVCNLSLYEIRKELKRLKEQGLVASDRYCEQTDEGNYIVNGYILTEKARKTEEYKRAWREERRLFKECFGIDIGGDNGWLK